MRIKTKILILTISTLVSILLISTYYAHKVVVKTHENALKDDAAKITRQIESYMPHHGGRVDLLELEEHFRELLFLSPHLVRVDTFTVAPGGGLAPLLSRSKSPVELPALTAEELSKTLSGEMTIALEQAEGSNYVNVTAPLRRDGVVSGVARFKVSHDEFYRLVASKRKMTLVVASFALLVTAGVLVVSMDRLVNRPIQNLLDAITRVKEGDLNAMAEPAAGDEIGRLTEHFNEMVSTIRKDSAEKESLLRQINQHNEELKQKVDLATLELLQRNEALRRANQSITEIQKKLGHSRRLAAVGQLSATVAHELGTPLHSVSGHLQLLMEEPGLGADATRRLTIMQSQLERITASIQNLLDTTRPPDAMGSLDLNRIIEDTTLLLQPESLSKQITVSRQLKEGLPAVYGSGSRVQEVFLSLLDNAMDACVEGGAIEISTSVSAEAPPGHDPSGGPWVKAAIKDNGRGIPAEYISHIFTPFYTTKAYGHGTGLGLAISQEIVQAHHGAITVESAPGLGSTFTVYLPVEAEGRG